MNTAQATASAMLTAGFTLLNGGSGLIYSGTQPSTPETALSGNTELVSATVAATALSGSITYSSGYMVGNIALSSSTLSPIATGTGTFMRMFQSGGTAAYADLTVGNNWLANEPVVVGQLNINSGNVYRCTTAGTTAASGGPTGTGTSITDGTAVWTYVAPGTTDVVVSNAYIQQGVNLNVTLAQLKMPAS